MKNKKNAKKGPGNICEHSLSYSELAPTDPWCNMLETLLGRKKYEEGMSDEQAPLLLILWNSLITFDGTPNVFQNDQMLIRSDQILAKRHYSMDSQVTLLIFVASILSHKSWHASIFFELSGPCIWIFHSSMGGIQKSFWLFFEVSLQNKIECSP